MKRIAALALLGINLSIAESPTTNEIVFKSLMYNESRMGEDICDSIYSQSSSQIKNNYLKSCWNDFDFIEYNSPVDTTVVFSLNCNLDNGQLFVKTRRTGQTCSDQAVEGIPGTKNFSEVLYTELMRLQELGVILNNRDSLDCFLKNEIAKMVVEKPCKDIDGVFYGEENGAFYLIGPGCCSLVEDPTQIKGKFAVAASGIRAVKVSGDRFYIQGAKIGVAFALFDMNGKLLKGGFNLTGYIQSPMTPVILKIQNQVITLK